MDQPVVGDFDMSGRKEQIARLDVEVLQSVALAEVVESFGRFFEIAEKFGARNSLVPSLEAFGVAILKAALGEFHHDDQRVFQGFKSLDVKEKRMVDRPHFAEAVEFSGGKIVGLVPDRRDFDRLGDVSGAHRFPDFSRAAATQETGEPVMLENDLSRLVLFHHVKLKAPLGRGAPSADGD